MDCMIFLLLVLFTFTSLSGHRPAQREWTGTGLICPMQDDIPTTGVYVPYSFRTVVWVLYVPHEQISESAVRRDLRFFVLIRKD